jgi:transposase
MSEQNTDLVEGLVTRPAINGRRTYSVEAKKTLVRRCLQPGVSVASIALAHGINANQLRRWMAQYSSSTTISHKPEASMRIVPVVTSPAAGLPLSSSSSCRSQCEFTAWLMPRRSGWCSTAWLGGHDRTTRQHASVARGWSNRHASWDAQPSGAGADHIVV